jgi:hypothetical protein
MPFQKLHNAIEAAQFRIKFKDIFNLKQFYSNLREWLKEYGWYGVTYDQKADKDYWETLYLERIGLAGEKEMWIYWRLQKLPVPNSYYKYHLDIDYHILYMFPAEVIRDGKKLKVNKGEIEIKVYSYVEFDYKGEWSKHPVLRFFNKLFPQRIIRKDLYDDHKKELYREVYTMAAFIKKWFKLRSFLPYEEVEPFHPSQAYPAWKKE